MTAQRRICLVVDVESYTTRDHQRQVEVQQRLATLLAEALRRAKVRSSACLSQDRGDGRIVLLPVGVDESTAIPGLIWGLVGGLALDNSVRPIRDRMRLRAALAQGSVRQGATGFVGHAVVDACRLVDSTAPRRTLAKRPDRDLVLALTDDLHRDITAWNHPGLTAADFRADNGAAADKDYSGRAWLVLPDPGSAAAPPRSPLSRRPSPSLPYLPSGETLAAGLIGGLAGGALAWEPESAEPPAWDPPDHFA